MKNNKNDILKFLKTKGTGFSKPESYFENFENNFQKNKVKITTGFKIPENYFEEIENIIIAKNKDSGSINKTGFTIPKNYFSTVEEKFYSNNRSSRVIPLRNYKTFKLIALSIAASLLLFFSLYNFSPNSGKLSVDSIELAEIESWLENDLISFNTYEISEIFTEIDLDIANNETDEVLDYFDYMDMETLILEN